MELPDNSSTSNASWIDDTLLQQEMVRPHALYATDLPPLSQSSGGDAAMFDPAFHHNYEDGRAGLQPAAEFQQQFLQGPMEQLEQTGGRASSTEDLASVRRVHKADREKLRRDRLNEQFTELASALDPDRPKIDKATILSDSVQELNELRAEVKRLKAEHSALLDESRDLSQEKSELREEKALLKSETDQLQAQIQQRLRLSMSWTTIDPSLMMGAAAFPYPVPVPAPAAGTPSTSAPVVSTSMPTPVIPSSPFLPPPGAFAMHPYAMFANRPPGANLPFFPYAPFPMVSSNSSVVDRPFPQYPSPMHPIIRSYASQTQDQAGEPRFKAAPFHHPTNPTGGTEPAAAPTSSEKSRDDNTVEDCKVSTEASPAAAASLQDEGSPSPVKQELQSLSSGSPEVHKHPDPAISA